MKYEEKKISGFKKDVGRYTAVVRGQTCGGGTAVHSPGLS